MKQTILSIDIMLHLFWYLTCHTHYVLSAADYDLNWGYQLLFMPINYKTRVWVYQWVYWPQAMVQ